MSFEHFDIENYPIFLERDNYKYYVKKIISLEFKSIINNDNFLIPARLYEPDNFNKNLIVFFHGGGWVRGSIDSHDCLCRKITNALNTRIISVDYRLAPQHLFPTALNDAFSVYCGLLEKIKFDELILSGDSSGGNLCAALCIKLREMHIQKLPSTQILFYPVLSNNFELDSYKKFEHEATLTKSMMEWFIRMYSGRDLTDVEMLNNKFLYPILQDDMSVFPKTLIISAEKDVLLDEQALFISKFKNTKAHQILINEASHGFMTYGKNHSKYASIAISQIKDLLLRKSYGI